MSPEAGAPGSDHDRKYLLNPQVRVTHCGGDEVLVKHGSRSRFSHMLRDEGRTKLLGRLLRGLDGPTSLADLRARELVREGEAEDAARLLAYLAKERIVITPEESLPHVYLSMLFGQGSDERIRSRRVGLVGSGFLGSRVARELARLRVKRLLLADDRTVGPHDRTYFDLPADLVEPPAAYTEVTRRGLERDGYTDVDVVEGELGDPRALSALFEESDFVVAALDSFSPTVLHAANEVALAVGRPWMSVYLDGAEALIGPVYVPGETLCYSEFAVQNEAASSLQDDYLAHKESLADRSVQTSHLALPPFLSIAGGWAVTGALSYLSAGQCPLIGRCLRVDFERFAVDYQDVLKLPRCPACVSTRPAYRHTFL